MTRRKTEAEKKLSGTTRAGRQTEPLSPSGNLGEPPDHLPEVEQKIWYELVDQIPDGVLCETDRIFLEITVKLLARFRAGDLEKSGDLKILTVNLGKLGMNPADRNKIPAPPPKPQPENRFAKFK